MLQQIHANDSAGSHCDGRLKRKGIHEATVGVEIAVDPVLSEEKRNGAGGRDVTPRDVRGSEENGAHVGDSGEHDAEFDSWRLVGAHVANGVVQRRSIENAFGGPPGEAPSDVGDGGEMGPLVDEIGPGGSAGDAPAVQRSDGGPHDKVGLEEGGDGVPHTRLVSAEHSTGRKHEGRFAIRIHTRLDSGGGTCVPVMWLGTMRYPDEF